MKFIHLFFFILFFDCSFILSFSDSLISQIHNTLKIDSITIVGNNQTVDDVILRELTFGVDDKVDSSILKFNRERIYSLGIFTNVDLFIKKVSDKNILIINVKESWYIWPIPFFEIKENDWNKLSYGIDLLIKNFRGRNESIRTRFSLGYDPGFRIHYHNPYLIRKNNISLEFIFDYNFYRNKSEVAKFIYGQDFDQHFIITKISVGKRFDLFNKVDFSTGFNYVETPTYFKGINSSRERIDRNYSASIRYTYDTRDLYYFPTDGFYSMIDFENSGFGKQRVNYQKITLDVRNYFSIYKDLSFKWKIFTRQTLGNNIPYYDFSFIGYTERIRGHTKLKLEGNNSLLVSIEFKFPIIKEYSISFDLPLIPKQLLSYRIAIYSQLFFDAGSAYLNNSGLNFKQFHSGWGFGLTFLALPYNIARIEIGFDETFNSELIASVGISF